MAVEELISTVMERLKEMASTEVYIGKPLEAGDAYIIPVSKITLGFGGGGNDVHGRGTGGGISIEPLAFLVIQHDEVKLLSLNVPSSAAGKLAELIPELIMQVKQRWDARGGDAE